MQNQTSSAREDVDSPPADPRVCFIFDIVLFFIDLPTYDIWKPPFNMDALC